MLYALLMSTACADSASCVVPGAREAQLARFRKWFKSGPGVTHDIALRTVEEGASDDTACVHAEFSVARETNWSAPASAQHPFGVFALKPVRRETKILSVAVKWIVCRRTALLSGGRALRKAVRKLRSEDEVMLLLLLHERALGSVSRWAPYFAMLPSVDDVVAPIAFDNASIALLHSPVFAAETRSYIALLKSRRARIAPLLNATLHDAIAKRAEKRGKKARPGEGGDVVDTMRRGAVEAQSDAAWTWAAHVLDSRALSYRGERLLVPLVDFFRYKPIGRGGEAQDWEQYHRLERSAFSLHADRDFALGEELKEDYGCMPSAQYFRNGFVPRVNPCNCARLLWSPLLIMLRAGVSDEARDEPRTAALRALSAEAGLSVSPKYLTMSPEYEIMCLNPEAHLVRGAPHPPQDPVLALLALDTMSLAEANACRADVAASRAAGGDACTLVLATGRKGCADAGACERGRSVAYARMLAMLRSQLNAFEAQSAVDEDECMLRNPVARLTLRPNDILAVQFRISEKRVLARAIDALRARAPGIDAAAAEAARQEGGDGDAVRGASWCDANAFNSWFGRKFDLAEGHFFRRGIAAALPEGAAPCPAGLVVHAAPTALDDSKSYGLFSIAHRGVNASEPYLCVPINFAVSLKQFYAAIPRAVELGLRESTLANLRPGGELVMDRASAQSCDVLGPLFRKMQRLYKRSDAMHELLLHLMHERFGRAERSEWWPYLRLLPAAPPVRTRSAGWGREFDEQALPFFDTCASARLGTVSPGTRRILQRHRDAVDRAFNGIESNVFALDRALFPSEVYTLGRYRWARAILESRCFWWNGERHLVPMLGFVNNGDGRSNSSDGAKRGVHATRPDSGAHYAISNALEPFPGGAEILTSYGLPNYELLLKHNFVLRDNAHDCFVLDFEMSAAASALERCAADDDACRALWSANALARMQRANEEGFAPALQYCVRPAHSAIWDLVQHVDLLFDLRGDSGAAIAQLRRMCVHQLERLDARDEENSCAANGASALVDLYAAEQHRLLSELIEMTTTIEY